MADLKRMVLSEIEKITHDLYNRINPSSGLNVFEEEIDRLLDQKQESFVSPDDIGLLVEQTLSSVAEMYEELKGIIDDLPKGKDKKLSVGKSAFTMESRKLVHDEKTSLINSWNYLEVGDGPSPIGNDYGKNSISCSKLISTCKNDEIIPLLRVKPLTMDRESKYPNSDIGKFLLEVRLSTVDMNFKGLITTGFLDDGYGVGFYAEYLSSSDPKYLIQAHRLDDGDILISMFKRKLDSNDIVYDNITPINLDVSPLILESFDILPEFDGKMITDNSPDSGEPKRTPSQNLRLIGSGDLSDNGHGPIDCVVDDTHNIVKTISPRYYTDGRESTCKTSIKSPDEKMKLSHLRLFPNTFYSETPSEEVGSHILKGGFGGNNFCMYELLTSVYNLSNRKSYICSGQVCINGLIIPVVGFKLINESGRVRFNISPFFKIPEDLIVINSEVSTKGLRKPYITFDSNRILPLDDDPGGFIGDTGGEDGKFTLGYDDSNRSRVLTKPTKYELSFVNILIELTHETEFVKKVSNDDLIRYSGNYNKYDYDFSVHDHDNFPYPQTDRDLNNLDDLDKIPSLIKEPPIIMGADGDLTTWVDNPDEYMTYSSKNI